MGKGLEMFLPKVNRKIERTLTTSLGCLGKKLLVSLMLQLHQVWSPEESTGSLLGVVHFLFPVPNVLSGHGSLLPNLCGHLEETRNSWDSISFIQWLQE